MPRVDVARRGGAHRFLRNGAGPESKDFWLFDLTTNKTHRLTNLSDCGYLNHFAVNA